MYFLLVKKKKRKNWSREIQCSTRAFIIDERKELLSVVLSVGGFGRMGSGLAIESDWKWSPSEILRRGWSRRSVIMVVLRLFRNLANVLGVSNNSFHSVYLSLIVILEFSMEYFEWKFQHFHSIKFNLITNSISRIASCWNWRSVALNLVVDHCI
mgnify:CR=1 FL=1